MAWLVIVQAAEYGIASNSPGCRVWWLVIVQMLVHQMKIFSAFNNRLYDQFYGRKMAKPQPSTFFYDNSSIIHPS